MRIIMETKLAFCYLECILKNFLGVHAPRPPSWRPMSICMSNISCMTTPLPTFSARLNPPTVDETTSQSSTVISTMLVLGSGNETSNSVLGPHYDVVCIQPRSRAPYPVSVLLTQFPVMQVACCELETRLAAATLQVYDNYYTGAVQQRR